MRFKCGTSHSRCTKEHEGRFSAYTYNQQKPMGKDRHLGPPDRTPDDRGFSIEPSVQAARSSRRHSGKGSHVVAMPPSCPTRSHQIQVMRHVSNMPFPSTTTCPPCRSCQQSGNPAQWRWSTPRRIAIAIRGFRAWDLFVARALLSVLPTPTSAYHLDPCMVGSPLRSSTTGCSR